MDTTNKISPEDRRLEAIGAVVDKHLGDGWRGQVADADREPIALEIEALAALGRTERWHAAIRTWAHVVRTREDAGHALIQWCIFTGYAAR